MEFKIPDFDAIIEIHEIILDEYGGLTGIPHPEYIEMAIYRPQNYQNYKMRCDIHLVAALILESIAKYHAFADGNKRTALVSTLFTYNRNGIKLSYSLHVNKRFERLVLDVARKNMPIERIRTRLRLLVRDFQE